MLLIRVLNQFCNPIEGSILKLHRLKAADTLSLLVETEDFNTHRSAYYNPSGVFIITLFVTNSYVYYLCLIIHLYLLRDIIQISIYYVLHF